MSFTVEEAKARRVCAKCKKAISKGSHVLNCTTGTGRWMVSSNLCTECVEGFLTELKPKKEGK